MAENLGLDSHVCEPDIQQVKTLETGTVIAGSGRNPEGNHIES